MKRFSILTIALMAIFCATSAFANDHEAGPPGGTGGNPCDGEHPPPVCGDIGGGGGGDIDSNVDNTNRAFGGDATAGAIAGAGVFDSGNSSSTSGVDFGSRNDFGGDGGDASLGAFNDFGGDANTSTSTSTNTSTSTKQGQAQSQDNDVTVRDDSVVNVDASDNSSYAIDNDFPVNTAAPVFAGNCSQGVSAQTQGFGGSIASGNSVCDYIAVAGAFIAGGDRTEAFRVLGKAETAADWRFMFSRIRMVITLGLL